MDHLPFPDDCDPLIIDIPYLAEQAPPYSKLEVGAFLKYFEEETEPSVAGGDFEVDSEEDIKDEYGHAGGVSPPELTSLLYTPQEMMAIAQAWLYFDTMGEVFGSKFWRSRFLTNDPETGTLLIATEHLNALIAFKNDAMRNSVYGPILRSDRDEIHRIEKIVQRARVRQARFTLYLRHTGAAVEDTWAKISLAISLFFEAITQQMHAYSTELKESLPVRELWELPSTMETPERLLLKDYMLQTGFWCVHQLDHLSSRLSVSSLTYLANLRRYPRPGITHKPCMSMDRCIAYNTDPMELECTHTETCGGCDHVFASSTELERVLESGGIPVLNCTRTKDGKIVLSYLRASSSLHYAAISHLWADGLGNARSNSLPFCQLDRLMQSVAEVDLQLAQTSRLGITRRVGGHRKTVNLWLDVYCIPVLRAPSDQGTTAAYLQKESPAEVARRLKRVAIARMDATYSWANFVLVLDSEVAHSYNADKLEILARIATCAWNSRCWTFQEQFLAERTVFQCLHTAVGWPSLGSDPFEDGTRAIFNELLDLTKPRRFRRTTDYSNFATGWNIFAGRTTTKQEDTLGILANVLEMSAAEIIRLDPAARMRAILAAQTELPLSILSLQHLSLMSPPAIAGSPSRLVPDVPESYLMWSPSGYAMDVTPSGFLLNPEAIAQSKAKLVSLPILEGSTWSFRIEDPTPDAQLRQRIYWLHLDRQQLDSLNASMQRHSVVILLDAVSAGRVSETRLGAWFLSAGIDAVGNVSVVYGGPLSWGITCYDEMLEGRDHAICATNLVSLTERILIRLDIDAWPKVSINRRLMLPGDLLSYVSKTDWILYVFLTFDIFGIIVTYIIGVATNGSKIPLILAGGFAAGLPLYVAVVLVLGWLEETISEAQNYLLAHSFHPDFDGAAPWRQKLRTALQTETSGSVTLRRRLMIIWPLLGVVAAETAYTGISVWARSSRPRKAIPKETEVALELEEGAAGQWRAEASRLL